MFPFRSWDSSRDNWAPVSWSFTAKENEYGSGAGWGPSTEAVATRTGAARAAFGSEEIIAGLFRLRMVGAKADWTSVSIA